jgi:hypothetical protein
MAFSMTPDPCWRRPHLIVGSHFQHLHFHA